MTFGSLLIIALVCHASFVGFLKSFTLGDMTFGSLLIIALVCHASFVHGFRVAKRSDDELEVTDPNAHISDLSSKQGMQSRGWVFSPGLTTMADPIGGHNSKGVFETCMNKSSAKVYGYVDGDAVGSIKTPQLSGSGTGSLEFGNCWRFGYVGVYKNGQTIATSSQQGRWKTTTFNFQDGDQLELRDEGGRSVIMIKAINLMPTLPDAPSFDEWMGQLRKNLGGGSAGGKACFKYHNYAGCACGHNQGSTTVTPCDMLPMDCSVPSASFTCGHFAEWYGCAWFQAAVVGTSSSPWLNPKQKCKPWNPVVAEADIKADMRVRLMKDGIRSNNAKNKANLKKGQVGIVLKISDGNGAAYIDFEDHQYDQWILPRDFRFLEVLDEALADVSTVVGASFTTREETDEGRR